MSDAVQALSCRTPLGIVVMGVSGSGKSTLGVALASRLGCAFLEGDDLHPAENVARMRAGRPLDDETRAPWLSRVAQCLDERVVRDGVAVASCSALKRRYRDTLRASVGAPLLFVWLSAPAAVLERRIAGRSGHYMPVALLQSQLDDLESPGPGERWFQPPEGAPLGEAVDAALAWIGAAQVAPLS